MAGKQFISSGTRKKGLAVVSNLFVYSIGICILLGKHIAFWNLGLHDGLWSFFLSTALVGAGFILLTFSFAEMVSMLPFTGGCYGYVRCSLGPWFGYLVGCCEATKYIIFHAIMVHQVAKVVYMSLDISSDWAPLIWLGTMALILPLQVYGKRMFWAATFLLALAVVVVFLIYLLEAGSAQGVSNFRIKAFDQDAGTFFQHLPLAVSFFAGIDAMRTCTDTQSNHTVPRDMVISMCVAAVLALSLIVAACSITADGINLSWLAFPLSEGFAEIMGMPLRDANWLSLPGALAGSFAFTYSFGRQLRSMAGSGLLPSFLSTAHAEQKVAAEESLRAAAARVVGDASKDPAGDKKDAPVRRGSFRGSLKGSLKKVDTAIKHHVPKKPVAALLFGSLLSYGLLLLGHFGIADFEVRYFHMCVLLATVVYSSLLAAYFVFVLRYSNLDRNFRSPFGLVGACASLLIFLIIFTCVCFLQPGEHSYTLAIFAGLSILYTLYYVLVAKKRQFFSKEEQEKFMKAYVVNANTNRKKSKKSGASSSRILSGVFAMMPAWLQPKLSANLPKDVSRASSLKKSASGGAVASLPGRGSAASLDSTLAPSVASDLKRGIAGTNTSSPTVRNGNVKAVLSTAPAIDSIDGEDIRAAELV